jgi:hypothetical protein
VRVGSVGLALQHGPEGIDVAADILARNRVITAVFWPLDGEVLCDEGGEIKARLLLLLPIALGDDPRCLVAIASTNVLLSGKTRWICTSWNRRP